MFSDWRPVHFLESRPCNISGAGKHPYAASERTSNHVPSESAFSIAGYFTRKQMAGTMSKMLEKCMFLSDKF
jgi:hypothetical protein